MSTVENVVRADLAQTKVQIHQMITAMHMSIAALDKAFQAMEGTLHALSDPPHQLSPEQIRQAVADLQGARVQILNSRMYLHQPVAARR